MNHLGHAPPCWCHNTCDCPGGRGGFPRQWLPPGGGMTGASDPLTGVLFCKGKRLYLLACKASRYCILPLFDSLSTQHTDASLSAHHGSMSPQTTLNASRISHSSRAAGWHLSYSICSRKYWEKKQVTLCDFHIWSYQIKRKWSGFDPPENLLLQTVMSLKPYKVLIR